MYIGHDRKGHNCVRHTYVPAAIASRSQIQKSAELCMQIWRMHELCIRHILCMCHDYEGHNYIDHNYVPAAFASRSQIQKSAVSESLSSHASNAAVSAASATATASAVRCVL